MKKTKTSEDEKKIRENLKESWKKDSSWYVASLLLFILLMLSFYSPSSEVLQLVFISLISFFVIMKSAGFIILSITDYAKKSGISEYLLGFVIVAFCTSLPELSTAFFSSIVGKGELVLGDVIGANIIDTTIVLGLVAIIGKKMEVGGKKITSIFILPILLLIFGSNGIISRIEGVILIISFIVYIGSLILQEKGENKLVKDIKFKSIWKDIVIFGFALAALLLASRWMVFSSLTIASYFNIPHFLIGLIIVAFGTTIPELTVEIKSVLSGVKQIAFGDIFGSFVTNICLVVGFAALINPITFDLFTFYNSMFFMILSIAVSLWFMKGKVILKKHGYILLGIYVIFLITQILIYVLGFGHN